MKNHACLDTGVITLNYVKNPPPEIEELFAQIKGSQITASVPSQVLIEAYWHLSRFPGGMEFAEKSLADFLKNTPVAMVQLDQSLIFKAGKLKTQYSTIFSLVDCIVIAYSLNNQCVLHTTEKGIKKLFPQLLIKEYDF